MCCGGMLQIVGRQLIKDRLSTPACIGYSPTHSLNIYQYTSVSSSAHYPRVLLCINKGFFHTLHTILFDEIKILLSLYKITFPLGPECLQVTNQNNSKKKGYPKVISTWLFSIFGLNTHVSAHMMLSIDEMHLNGI